MKRDGARAPRTFAVAALLLAASACSKPDEGPKTMTLGFTPPPGMALPTPSASSTAAPAAPAFTSYFASTDAGDNSLSTAPGPATSATATIPDPDIALTEAMRTRLNGCFPLAQLATGTSRNVAITFVVIATGRVTRYDISGATTTDGAFYDCIHGIADSASFPARSTVAVPGGPPPVPDIRTVTVSAGATAS